VRRDAEALDPRSYGESGATVEQDEEVAQTGVAAFC
jgi:hypothetical protein